MNRCAVISSAGWRRPGEVSQPDTGVFRGQAQHEVFREAVGTALAIVQEEVEHLAGEHRCARRHPVRVIDVRSLPDRVPVADHKRLASAGPMLIERASGLCTAFPLK